MQLETAHQWIEQHLPLRARADLARHLCEAETAGLDLDCRIGPGLAGPGGVWLWLFGGQFFVFELTAARCWRLKVERGVMTVRLLRPLSRPQPDHLPGVIKDVHFDREPAPAGEPIAATLTWSIDREVPWAASLEHARPEGGHQRHWAYPPPSALGGRPTGLRFSPPADDDGQPPTGLLAAFISVWHVPDPTEPFHRVPITPLVGRLLDLQPAEKASKQG